MFKFKKLSKIAITLCVFSALVFLPEKAHSVAGIAVTVDNATGFLATITTDATAAGGFIQEGTIALQTFLIVNATTTSSTEDLSHIRVFLFKVSSATATEGVYSTFPPTGTGYTANTFDRVHAVIYGLPGDTALGVEAIRLPVIINKYKQAFDIDVRGYSAFSIRFYFNTIHAAGYKLFGKRIKFN